MLAQRLQDPALLLEAHIALGYTLYPLGEFVPAREHLEQGCALYDPQQHHSLAFLYGGVDPGVYCLSLGAWSLWILGYPDQALKKSGEAVALAQRLSHPHSLGFALCFATELHQFRREVSAAHERAEQNSILSTEYGLPFWLARSNILRGWVLTEQGEGELGIGQICQGLAAYRVTGAGLWLSYLLALLAEAYGTVGHTEKGLRAVAEALTLVDKTEGRFYEAELYRLKGELLLVEETQTSKVKGQMSKVEGAEACFHKAIDIARSQEAKSWELRAATSLARLWQQQSKTAEAHQLLSEMYGWFTEGFDTQDLQDAKALLAELA